MPRERKGVSKRKSKVRDTIRYFIIASEGADTERIYFEGLQGEIETRDIVDKKIKLEFLTRKSENERRRSSHKAIIQQLDGYKKAYQVDERDELWLIIDRDKQNNPLKNISGIAQSCLQKGYFLALSNPNFELWLLLHLTDLSGYTVEQLDDFLHNKKKTSSRSALEAELSRLLEGYNKSKFETRKLMPFIEDAIKRAKALDINPEERWIECRLGTRIYRLAENVLQKD